MRPRNLEKEEAIRSVALQIIAEEGLENLSMQKLAKAANVSPRTIYLKYTDKDDFLIKLFIDEVLGSYEAAVLENFSETMDFAEGIQRIWLDSFRYFQQNRQAFVLMQYGKSSPLLNKAFQERNISEGQFFAPIHRFVRRNIDAGLVIDLPFAVYRAFLSAPLLELINEYFDHIDRSEQIITEDVILRSCEVIINGLRKE